MLPGPGAAAVASTAPFSRPSTGSLWGELPRLHRYHGVLRLPVPPTLGLHCLGRGIVECARCSLPGTVERDRVGPGLGSPATTPESPQLGGQGLTSSCGTPVRVRPALGPRWDLGARPLWHSDAAGAHRDGDGSHVYPLSRLDRHGPHACSSRLRSWVTPVLRESRFRLLARLCRVGLVTHQVPQKGFMLGHLDHAFLLSQAFPLRDSCHTTIVEMAKHQRAGHDELPEPTLESVDVSTTS